MRKKQYEFTARILKELKPNPLYFWQRVQWKSTVETFAENFKKDSEKFDINKFFKACGYKN